MKTRFLIAVLCASLVLTIAHAEEADIETDRDSPTLGVGARVGGYGFREVNGSTLSWNDCRMNGTGLFGTIDLGRHFFGELSADLYHATGSTVDSGMDRLSFHTFGAFGAKMLPDEFITPYIQVGGGPEFTLHGHRWRAQRRPLSLRHEHPSVFDGAPRTRSRGRHPGSRTRGGGTRALRRGARAP